MAALRRFAAARAVRWSLAIAAGFTAMALLLFAFIFWQTAILAQNRIDGMVNRAVDMIAAQAPDQVGASLAAWLAKDVHDVHYGGLFRPDGTPQTGNLPVLPPGLPADGLLHRAVIGPVDADRDGDGPEIVRGLALRLPDGRLLVVGYDIDELEDVQAIIVRALVLGLLPTVVLSLLGGVLLAGRSQRRITALDVAIRRIIQGQLRERLPVHGKGDELDRLAGSVNLMLREIEKLVGELRGVGDNIAHDLRTPLTRVRARLERSRDEACTREEFREAADRAIASVDQALAVIAALLRIGEIEHRQRQSAFAAVDLADILRDAVDLYEPAAEERGVALRLRISGAGSVPGDRDLLLEAVGNLVDNAVKFSPVGAEVLLVLARDDEAVRLCVCDQGRGIPNGERERVLERFYRSDKSRTIAGSGLGLSLVAAVVSLHGFRLRIGGAGSGCVVEVICPFAA